MPFKSKAQMRMFYAKEAKGELPEGTAKTWVEHTKNLKNLPEHVKKASDAFSKIANQLFKPEEAPPIKPEVIQTQQIQETENMKRQGMTPSQYRRSVSARSQGVLAIHRKTPKAL